MKKYEYTKNWADDRVGKRARTIITENWNIRAKRGPNYPRFSEWVIGSEEYAKRLARLPNEPKRVILNTKEGPLYALAVLGVSEKEQQSLFYHELCHYNEAKAKGLQARFCLTFYRTEAGELAMIPGTQLHATLFNALNDEKRRAGLKSAIAAPRDLSATDERLLQME